MQMPPQGHGCAPTKSAPGTTVHAWTTCLRPAPSTPGSWSNSVFLGKQLSYADSAGDESLGSGGGNLNPRGSQDCPRALQARLESGTAQEPLLTLSWWGSGECAWTPAASRVQGLVSEEGGPIFCKRDLLAEPATCLPLHPSRGRAVPEHLSRVRLCTQRQAQAPLAGSSQTGKQSMQPQTRARKREWTWNGGDRSRGTEPGLLGTCRVPRGRSQETAPGDGFHRISRSLSGGTTAQAGCCLARPPDR